MRTKVTDNKNGSTILVCEPVDGTDEALFGIQKESQGGVSLGVVLPKFFLKRFFAQAEFALRDRPKHIRAYTINEMSKLPRETVFYGIHQSVQLKGTVYEMRFEELGYLQWREEGEREWLDWNTPNDLLFSGDYYMSHPNETESKETK